MHNIIMANMGTSENFNLVLPLHYVAGIIIG